MPDIATALKNAINNINTNKEKQVKDQPQITHSQQLDSIINQWDKDEAKDTGAHKVVVAGPIHASDTTNVSKETFNCVRDNPGCKQLEIANLMEARGFKPQSVRTLMVQMVKVGSMRRDDEGRYYAVAPAYTPVKISKLRAVRDAEQKQKKKELAAARALLRSGGLNTKAAPAIAPLQTKAPAKAGIAALRPQASQPVLHTSPNPQAITTQGFDADQLLSTLSFNQAIALYKKLKTMLGEV